VQNEFIHNVFSGLKILRFLDQGRLNAQYLPGMKEIRDACEILDRIPQGEMLPANTNADLVVLGCA
jgi:hypothetical protein